MRKAIRAIAVLLCAALLLPMCGCTVEPNLFMDVEEISERYPGVTLDSGYNEEARFVLDLEINASLDWMKHLTDMRSVEVRFKHKVPDIVVALPDLSDCKKLEMIRFSGQYDYYENWDSVLEVNWGPDGLDLSALAGSKVHCLRLRELSGCAIELGDGVETLVFEDTTPDMEKLAAMPNLKELQLFLDETCDLTPLASSESLHLLHFDLYSKSWGPGKYKGVYFPEWDLAPLKGSNIDTLMFGENISTKLLESLEGAENIRHLQLSRTDTSQKIGLINSLPNLETVAIVGMEDRATPWASWAGSKNSKEIKDIAERLACIRDESAELALGWFMDEGGTVIALRSADDYYDWYYKNAE